MHSSRTESTAGWIIARIVLFPAASEALLEPGPGPGNAWLHYQKQISASSLVTEEKTAESSLWIDPWWITWQFDQTNFTFHCNTVYFKTYKVRSLVAGILHLSRMNCIIFFSFRKRKRWQNQWYLRWRAIDSNLKKHKRHSSIFTWCTNEGPLKLCLMQLCKIDQKKKKINWVILLY